MTIFRLRFFVFCAAAILLVALPRPGDAAVAAPMAQLQALLSQASSRAPGHVAIAIEDLATGYTSGVNASASMPAASTIKIPVMIEVFRQMSLGTVDLNTVAEMSRADRDWGSGDLADESVGTEVSVRRLLWLMITDSDNTATNMLIRLVGRTHINSTMFELGLHKTRLNDYIRTSGTRIRYSLRSSPHDMVSLLGSIARNQMIDEWSSREMLAILTGQRHNTLLPAPLPKGLAIAHKTGTLHDTLNDVGIVYRDQEPYVIAVMTTNLPSLNVGRRFIRHVSRIAYDELGRFERWREDYGLPGFSSASREGTAVTQPLAPDLQMWDGTQHPPDVVPIAPPAEPGSHVAD